MVLLNRKSGFTLIELLVVISIIGLLAAVVLVSLNSSRVKSRDSRRKADIRQMVTALELYFNENNSYPIAGGPGPACSSWIYATASLQASGFSTFVAGLPKDPLAGWSEYLFLTPDYTPGPASGKYYIVAARLENLSSQESSDFTTVYNNFNAKWPSCAAPLPGYNYIKGVF